MSPYDIFGQSEIFTDDPDFVLEQISQGLDEFKAEFGRQTSDIVMNFDICGKVSFFGARFDNIGVKGALSEELCVWYLRSF